MRRGQVAAALVKIAVDMERPGAVIPGGPRSDHLAEWSEAIDFEDLPAGFFLGMEGAGLILWLDQVNEWYEQGLRVICLGHYGPSRYAHGTGTGTDGGVIDGAAGTTTTSRT